MKNSNTLFLLLLIIFSCSGNDNNTQEEESYYIGTWELTNLEMGIAQDMNNDGIFSTNVLDELDCFQPTLLTFKEDLTFESFGSKLKQISFANTTIVYDCEGVSSGLGTWSEVETGVEIGSIVYPRVGNQLILNHNDPIPGFVNVVYTKK